MGKLCKMQEGWWSGCCVTWEVEWMTKLCSVRQAAALLGQERSCRAALASRNTQLGRATPDSHQGT